MDGRYWRTALAAAALLAAAGCSSDLGRQVAGNEQLRTQVVAALASRPALAVGAVDRFMATDSVRVAVVDAVLKNDAAAQQVLVRIGTSPQALDMAIGVAVRDSAMRTHVLTLLKGVEMASAGR